MRTEVCERFGIEFPLFAFSHCRDVVAAVTNAGGFGVLGAVAFTPERLDEELRWIDDHVGGRPYGVDVLVPARIDEAARGGTGGLDALLAAIPEEHWTFLAKLFDKYGVPLPDFDRARTSGARGPGVTERGAAELVEVALAHPIRLIASALGPPPPHLVEAARAADVPVAALVGTAEHARRQVAA
ncbi:MAG: nitronate monooxygenase, partial [Actinomadura rubrobrunea]|nr:nitronate monooxygenase [Actinomadura rubrobrunea]